MELVQWEKGTKLHGRYEITKYLGAGGFGSVYKAIDHKLGRMVAIKQSVNSLEYEYRILQELHNVPYICHAIDHFTENKYHYLVISFVEGISLSQHVKDKGGKMSASELLPAMKSVCVALDQMHRKLIIHRDISAGNLILTEDGDLYLIDFGAATMLKNEGLRNRLTFFHRGLEAPESCDPDKQCAATDIYSLCATMIYLMSGNGVPGVEERRIADPVPMLLRHMSLSSKQQNILLKGIQPQIDKRYQNVCDFYCDLVGANEIVENPARTIRMEYQARTETGIKPVNQDNFMIDKVFAYTNEDCQIDGEILCDKGQLHIVAIADGVSHANHAELASKAAIQAVSHFIDAYRYSDVAPEILIENLFDQVNEKIITLGKKIGKTATTLTVFMWRNDLYYVANVGDSPVYLLRNKKVEKISTPHTLVERKIQSGQMVVAEDLHKLSRYIGKKEVLGSSMVSVKSGKLQEGDVFLLCSDGVSDGFDQDSMKKVLSKKFEKVSEAIWKKISKRGFRDNCTAVVMRFM